MRKDEYVSTRLRSPKRTFTPKNSQLQTLRVKEITLSSTFKPSPSFCRTTKPEKLSEAWRANTQSFASKPSRKSLHSGCAGGQSKPVVVRSFVELPSSKTKPILKPQSTKSYASTPTSRSTLSNTPNGTCNVSLFSAVAKPTTPKPRVTFFEFPIEEMQPKPSPTNSVNGLLKSFFSKKTSLVTVNPTLDELSARDMDLLLGFN